MTKNTLKDLNDHLFMQLERLNDEELDKETLDREIQRSKALSNVASKIIDNGRLVLDAQKFADDKLDANKQVPRMLEG